ncbi:MAG: ABC-F family ATP-binding cassette domain-containing protein [Lachnospiraceae bacterium]|nr:ABC-F family ATP-binding cassette domain-containing protein [Lachnospiraceae bacterium]
MLLSCQNIRKEFVTGVVLSNVSFHIEAHEKAALVGINGAGKTTLLRILVGENPPDEGIVTLSKGATLGYLAQDGAVLSDHTIYEELLSVKAELVETEHKLRECESKMKHTEGEALDALMELYARLTESFERAGGYAYRSELIGVLKGLGFEEADFDRSIATLSGGQKTRVALGKLLLDRPDLIILDEPTNHLDMSSIAWLETYLKGYPGAVLIVSHDRYFLDRVVTKIIELENGKSTVFNGNYTLYSEKKEQLRQAQLKAYMNQQQEIRHQEEVIEKLRSFNREKSIKRAESREKMLAKVEVLERPTQLNAEMKLKLTPHRESGHDVLKVEGLTKGFGDHLLFSDVSFEITRGEHVAIIGDNGTGKTTLLKILNELERADEGEFTLGSHVEIGYYDQEHHVLHPEKTVFEEISDEYPVMTITEIRNTLAAFLFTGDDVFKLIRDLSGGERGRLSLAKLMLSDCNFLILDEPTNHLDLLSKEVLETAIRGYEGTVLYVSHDRYFINRTATRILELTGQRFLNYIGNYDYYLEKHEDVLAADRRLREAESGAGQKTASGASSGNTDSAPAKSPSGSAPSGGRGDWQAQKEEQARLRKKENDLKKCEEKIADLEKQIALVDAQLSDPANASNSVKLQELTQKRSQLNASYESTLELWEQLAD